MSIITRNIVITMINVDYKNIFDVLCEGGGETFLYTTQTTVYELVNCF